QEEGKKTTGWPALQELLGELGSKIAECVREWLGLVEPAHAADFTPPPIPWPKQPGSEAFHGFSGRIVKAIEPSTEADPAALLIQMLLSFGNAAGRAAHFRVEDTRHFTNEFVILVGRTSKARKGTSWERINRLMEQADEPWHKDHIASGVS